VLISGGTAAGVSMDDFRNALDSWQIDRNEAYAALRELERENYS